MRVTESQSNKKHPIRKLLRPFILLPILVFAAITTLIVLELTNTTHLLHAKKAMSGSIPTIPRKTQQSSQNQTNKSSKSNTKTGQGVSGGSGNQSLNPTPTTTNLIAPYGTFVSNHKPGQNGTSTKEESVCNTTPGATCYIKFTQGSIVKTLESQVADNGGVTSWIWDINKAGLTTGSWKITATATLGGQSKTTTDPIVLEIL